MIGTIEDVKNEISRLNKIIADELKKEDTDFERVDLCNHKIMVLTSSLDKKEKIQGVLTELHRKSNKANQIVKFIKVTNNSGKASVLNTQFIIHVEESEDDGGSTIFLDNNGGGPLFILEKPEEVYHLMYQ